MTYFASPNTFCKNEDCDNILGVHNKTGECYKCYDKYYVKRKRTPLKAKKLCIDCHRKTDKNKSGKYYVRCEGCRRKGYTKVK